MADHYDDSYDETNMDHRTFAEELRHRRTGCPAHSAADLDALSAGLSGTTPVDAVQLTANAQFRPGCLAHRAFAAHIAAHVRASFADNQDALNADLSATIPADAVQLTGRKRFRPGSLANHAEQFPKSEETEEN